MTALLTAFLEWVASHLGWEALVNSIHGLVRKLRRYRSGRPADHWVQRINAAMAAEVRIHCTPAEDPVIVIEGDHPLTSTQAASASAQRQLLEQLKRPNDMHGIVVNDPVWNSARVHLAVRTLDFAGVRALRLEGRRPLVLSAGALLVCSATQEVLLHRRGLNMDKYSSCLHTTGGGYMPPSSHGRDDGTSLRATAEREVHEETRLALPPGASPPRLLAQELATGFIQLLYLGFDLPRAAVERAQPNWEGHIERVPFSALHAVLLRSDWVPSGKAHVLAWLALGAPGAGDAPRFGVLTPTQLFAQHVGS